jgi:hypothetical protein
VFQFTKSHLIKGALALGFGLAVMAQSAEAKISVLSVATSTDRGSHVVVNAGSKWKSKPVVVEVGVKSKKTWKWSRVASGRTDKAGKTTMCSSRTLNAGTQLRVKSGVKVISTIKIVRVIQLSGCGYMPPIPVVASVAPTTTLAPTTTVAPTTTTTLPPPTPAPTALALSAATDTGDSQSDGITKETSLAIVGSSQANSSVQVYVDGVISGSACTANGAGVFSCSMGTVTEGTKAVTAKATGPIGESVASQPLTVVVDRTAPTISWSMNGNHLFSSGNRAMVTLTISEATSSFSASDLEITSCTTSPNCVIGNFSGALSSYAFEFSTISDATNGGSVGISNAAFSDVAGNVNASSQGPTIMHDVTGPVASFSLSGLEISIWFDEQVFGFDANDVMGIEIGPNGSQTFSFGGWEFYHLRNFSGDRRHWTFYADIRIVDSIGLEPYFSVAIDGEVLDKYGNQVSYQEWIIG